MGIFNPHPGSWKVPTIYGMMGLPDIGATEVLAEGIGAGTTPEGGSDIFPNEAPSGGGVWGDGSSGITDYNTQSPYVSVLGDNATNNNDNNNPPPAPTGGFTDDIWHSLYPGWDRGPAEADYNATGGPSGGGGGGTTDPYAQIKEGISSGWDAYINSLNDMLNQGLPSQRTAQEGIAGSQYAQGQNVLGTQLQQGNALLGTQRERTQSNQARTLRDLSSNIRNMFHTGNVMLGSMGAGDSSAANQYSYALTKMGSRQRGDVMRQGADIMKEIDSRETNLKNIYDSEIRNLGFEKDQKMGQIAEWFYNAQNQIRESIGRGEQGKSQDLENVSRDILTQAQSQLSQIDQNAQDRYSALQQWAAGVSDNIGQLRQNMQGIQQYAPQMPGYSPMQGSPQVDSRGNLRLPIGYGSSTEEKQPLFQNPSWLSG